MPDSENCRNFIIILFVCCRSFCIKNMKINAPFLEIILFNTEQYTVTELNVFK